MATDQHRVMLVTGASRGIGAAVARAAAVAGYDVAVNYSTSPHHADAVCHDIEALGRRAIAVAADMADEAQVVRMFEAIDHEFGRLDVMFNNAGIVGVVGSVAETSIEQWDRTVAVLMRGVFLGMKHAARVMVPQRSGSIISTSSTAGVMGGLGPHCYTACKHAVIGLTKSVASELSRKGIRVNAISPGSTVSPMTASFIMGDVGAVDATTNAIAAGTPLGVAGMPIDIANAALFLASDESKHMTGQTMVIDGGQTTDGGGGRVHRQPPVVVREAGRRD